MSDDLFSRLFELFNQPGPVNWKLAAEVSRHLAGEREPIEPWAAEEFRELTRLTETRLELVAPFRLRPAEDVIPLDGRTWAEKSLEGYAPLVEPFAGAIGTDEMSAIMGQLAPAMIGLQVGSLVGGLSTWAMASFDAGLPPFPQGPLRLIVPNIEAFDMPEVDRREVRLWVAANEVSFRAVSDIPWIHDHLASLLNDYAAASQIDPSKLSGLVLGGGDPIALEKAIEEAGGLEGLVGGDEAEGPRRELEAFLGTLSGCARLLARRAISDLCPAFDEITERRDRNRSGRPATQAIGVDAVPAETIAAGDEFNQEVERRYGDDALETLWADPTRMPSASELSDPTEWAARVLLDGWT